MIVTRQRRKPFPWKRLMLPVAAVALLAFALVWQPSRNVLAKGPLAPVWRATAPFASAVAQPFHYAAQNQLLTERNREIAVLKKQLAQARNRVSAKDKRVAALSAEVTQLQQQAAQAAAAPARAASQTANRTTVAATPAGGDLTVGATADMRRTAAYWSNMDPSNAAKVVQRLPITYTARILALMSPDNVGAILDALPASYAAKLTQDHPELKK